MNKGPLLLMMAHAAACWTTSAAEVRPEPHVSTPHGVAPALLRVVPVLDERFLFNLPDNFVLPDAGDTLGARLLAEYGAVLVAGKGVTVPPRAMFSSEEDVAGFQSCLRISAGKYRLQAAAAGALAAAQAAAERHGCRISAADGVAAARSYADTVTLWRSRVEPGLRYWIVQGRVSTGAARDIRSLSPREQALAIIRLEQEGMFFGSGFAKSILSSVAPPGASQHLALLAFDVKEHRHPAVRRILEDHGWYQTVVRDAPHFTYLGVAKSRLQSLGLMAVREGDREYWIPRSARAFPDGREAGGHLGPRSMGHGPNLTVRILENFSRLPTFRYRVSECPALDRPGDRGAVRRCCVDGERGPGA